MSPQLHVDLTGLQFTRKKIILTSINIILIITFPSFLNAWKLNLFCLWIKLNVLCTISTISTIWLKDCFCLTTKYLTRIWTSNSKTDTNEGIYLSVDISKLSWMVSNYETDWTYVGTKNANYWNLLKIQTDIQGEELHFPSPCQIVATAAPLQLPFFGLVQTFKTWNPATHASLREDVQWFKWG